MIPKTQVTVDKWNSYETTLNGYKSSTMHTSTLPTIVNKLKNVLGDHIVNRNVLLSSGSNGYYSNAYTWTTSYATLMSVGQLTGTFATTRNKYDDGEANYKLPLFNYESYKMEYNFWTRCIYNETNAYCIYNKQLTSNIEFGRNVTDNDFIRPLIYLR